jgi:hypothetical protein
VTFFGNQVLIIFRTFFREQFLYFSNKENYLDLSSPKLVKKKIKTPFLGCTLDWRNFWRWAVFCTELAVQLSEWMILTNVESG